ncbi:MAG: hypothetical protein WAQ28_09875 [Bacteroidia bacterium]
MSRNPAATLFFSSRKKRVRRFVHPVDVPSIPGSNSGNYHVKTGPVVIVEDDKDEIKFYHFTFSKPQNPE